MRNEACRVIMSWIRSALKQGDSEKGEEGILVIVRVFNKADSSYYMSEIYGIVNRRGDFYLVDQYENGEKRLGLIPYLDVTSEQVPHPVNVECADSVIPDQRFSGSVRKKQ